MHQDAIEFFNQESFVYEGILLGRHDYERGGKFLVLKTYKGSASTFDVLDLPGGSSCYESVPAFKIGVISNYGTDFHSFDGFIADDYVDVWKDKGLIYTGWSSPSLHLKLCFLFVVASAVVGGLQMLKRLKKVRAF